MRDQDVIELVREIASLVDTNTETAIASLSHKVRPLHNHPQIEGLLDRYMDKCAKPERNITKIFDTPTWVRTIKPGEIIFCDTCHEQIKKPQNYNHHDVFITKRETQKEAAFQCLECLVC